MDFQNALSKLLGNDKSIKEVHIDQKVIDEIVKIAINADPKEYVALLSGKIEKKILKITGLIFLPFKASGSSAVMEIFMMPMTTKAVGSVHSHPGPSAQPSKADLTFFAKNGYFHMIICRPYSQSTIKAYDLYGNPMTFEVKDLRDEVEIKQWEDLDIDEELFDEEFIKELKENDNIENNKTDDNNTQEEIDLTNKKNDPKPAGSNPTKQATLNLEFEYKGKKVVKEIPLPPEYEPGDQVDVDIRTDKTPNDNIDEIIVNVRKADKIKSNPNKVITVTPQKKALLKNNNQRKQETIERVPEADVKPSENIEEVKSEKSSEEIEQEIKQMEADIAKLKEENERLKRDL